MRLSSSSRFREASKRRLHVCIGILVAVVALGIAAALIRNARFADIIASAVPPAAAWAIAASVLILLAGLSGAAFALTARNSMLRGEARLDALGAIEADRAKALKRAAWPAGWPQLAASLFFSVLSIVASWRSLTSGLVAAAPIAANPVAIGIGAILLCFPFVVIERHLAAMREDDFPESENLARLMRVLIAALLVFGVGRLMVAGGFSWGVLTLRAVALLTLGVGVELTLRAAAYCFTPFAAPDQAAGFGASAIAGQLRFSLRSGTSFRDNVRRTLGIDVAQSWALGYLRRAAPPAVAGLCIAAWLLTGLVTLPTTERAIYERFGRPVGVLGPGLHFILPWPLGQLRRVELGVMHDVPLGADGVAQNGLQPASLGDDRLWDRPHPGDATYLIASETRNQQGFQVVDVDMRIIWQVGETDRDALDFAYQTADPALLVRQLAGRILGQRYAGSTLPAVLVEDRSAFIGAFRDELQKDCDALRSGVRIAAVVIEAVHPPAGAASAYHAVQASEIKAQVSIAQAKGSALELQAQSLQEENATRNAAAVAASAIVTKARAEAVYFDADRAAWRREGAAFTFERRLEEIARALPARQLIVVDHRISPESLPLLDLRGAANLP